MPKGQPMSPEQKKNFEATQAQMRADFEARNKKAHETQRQIMECRSSCALEQDKYLSALPAGALRPEPKILAKETSKCIMECVNGKKMGPSSFAPQNATPPAASGGSPSTGSSAA